MQIHLQTKYYKSRLTRYQTISKIARRGMYANNADAVISSVVIPQQFKRYTNPVSKPAVNTAFEICFPIMLAKKKVYSIPIIGCTATERTVPTRILSIPTAIKTASNPSRTTGAHVKRPSGRKTVIM